MPVSQISASNVVAEPAPVKPRANTDSKSTTQTSQTAQESLKAPKPDTVTISPQAKQQVQQQVASDGDSAAVEAAESRATKLAEKANNGFAPKATTSFHKIA
jgi:hypothetical protein